MISDWLAALLDASRTPAGWDVDALLPQRRVVDLPMITRFRGITSRQALIFRGPAGWSEFSPFVEYAAPEASRWLAAALEFGHREAPAPLRAHTPLNGTIPDVAPTAVPGLIDRYPGVGTLKIKIAGQAAAAAEQPSSAAGQGRSFEAALQADLARIRAVRECAPHARLRCDANAAYTLEQAQRALAAIAELPGAGDWLEYVEQPVAAVEDMARLREWIAARDLPIRLAADESIRKAADPYRVAALGAADVIIVKVQPLGGVHAAAEVVAGCGLPAVVSSALETGIGLRAGALLAACLPVTAQTDEIFSGAPACGLGTAALFETDVLGPSAAPAQPAASAEAAAPVDASAPVGTLPAARAVPDPARLTALTAPRQAQDWWDARVRECLDVLAAAAD